MSEFVVNEQACENLMQNMDNYLLRILYLDENLVNSLPQLQEALGDDSHTLSVTMQYIAHEIKDASDQMKIIRQRTEEYMNKVKQIHVFLGR